MSESETKARLERAVHRGISWAEWRHLRRAGLVEMYEHESLGTDAEDNWREFVRSAAEHLSWLRSFEEDKAREEIGLAEAGDGFEFGIERGNEAVLPDTSTTLSRRTAARSNALSALNMLRARDKNEKKMGQRARIHSTHKPRGGVDGTHPQWVIFMGIEAWIPADDVKRVYRDSQQVLLAEEHPPRTGERAFQVAEFVWNEERLHGSRPPWPVLLERWNDWPLTEPFKNWRDFRTYFLRGAKATPPRYRASTKHLTEEVRARTFEGAFELWVRSFRE